MMKTAIFFMGRKRPGFDPQWGQDIIRRARQQLADSDLPLVEPPTQPVDNETLTAAIAETRQAGAEVAVIVQPTMSDGNLAATFSRLWAGPIVLWATPERPDADKVTACSLVGTHCFAATLRQMGHPFEMVYGMPGQDAAEDLDRAIRLAGAAVRLARARVGLCGYHAPGFVDMQADAATLMRTFGVQLQHVGLDDLRDGMNALDASMVDEDLTELRTLGLDEGDIDEQALRISSRYYLAIRQLLDDQQLDGLALRCWPELPRGLGVWPYLAMVRLLGQGQTVCPEGDVDGALTGMLAGWLGLGDVLLTDWLAHDDETITLWHSGDAPLSLCLPVGHERGPRLARHFNNDLPVVVDASLQPEMPVTLLRLWRCDESYHLTGLQGTTRLMPTPLAGVDSLVDVDGGNVRERFENLCHAGMPHHVAVIRGQHRQSLRRLARLLNIAWLDI